MKVYIHIGPNRQRLVLQLEKEPFASGGEGNLHKIVSPGQYRSFVAKMYHPAKRTRKKEDKIRYLINNPPNIQQEGGHNAIVWAKAMIYDQKGFAGFIMPFARGQKLGILASQKIPRKHRSTWERFSFSRPESMKLRLSICFNIAVAVYQLHATQHYVLVDLKPDNIIIQPNGLVSIVDMDSMEIIEGNQVLHPAAVVTPEYAPPEYYRGTKPGSTPVFDTWDRFSMAVIFYKLLFGIHPYAGSCHPPYDKINSLHEKIEHGLFVHSSEKSKYMRVVPPPHRRFREVAENIQELFIRCFTLGHENIHARPSSEEWCATISGRPLVKTSRPLPSREYHFYNVAYSAPTTIQSLTNLPRVSMKPPRLPSKPVKRFGSSNVVDYVFLAIGSIASFAIVKSLFFTIIASLMVMRFTYGLRKETSQKKKLKKAVKRQSSKLLDYRISLDKTGRKIDYIKNEKQKEIKLLDRKQQGVLIEERKKIDALKSEFHKFITEQDNKVIELHQLEEEELKALDGGDELIKEKNTKQQIKHQKEEITRHEEQLAYVGQLENKNIEATPPKGYSFLPKLGEELTAVSNQYRYTINKVEKDKIQAIRRVSRLIEDMERRANLGIEDEWRAKTKKIEDAIRLLKRRYNDQQSVVKNGVSEKKLNQKLKQFAIKDSASDIFKTTKSPVSRLVNELARKGINTAADIAEINDGGKIVKANGSTVLILSLDSDASVDLWSWKNNLIRNIELASSNPTYKISTEEEYRKELDRLQAMKKQVDDTKKEKKVALKESLGEDYTALVAEQDALEKQYNDQITSLEVEKTEKIAKVWQSYEVEIKAEQERLQKVIKVLQNRIVELEDSLNQTADKEVDVEAKQREIEERYDKLHEALMEVSRKEHERLDREIAAIKEETIQRNENLVNKQEILPVQTNNMLVEYEQKVENFNELNKEYAELNSEYESFDAITFWNYVMKILSFK